MKYTILTLAFWALMVGFTAACSPGQWGDCVNGCTSKGDKGDQGVPGLPGLPGHDGNNGQDGVGIGIQVTNANLLACQAGGSTLTVYRDLNNDGTQDVSDTLVSVSTVCNGVNGSDGVNGNNGADGQSVTVNIELANVSDCPTGGYKFTSNTSTNIANVCNGLQGLQGIAGQAGTQITPVKFCSSDNSAFPEYGLKVGNDVYAVYWGVTPASPSANQAFLAKLTSGSYMSTGGNNCQFTLQ